MRISGLSSGMDIDNMVAELMQAKRAPLNKLNQQKQLLDWKREAYREVSTKLVSFRNDKLQSNINALRAQTKSAGVTGTNPDAVSVTASNGSTNLAVDIKVNQLAESAEVNVQFAGVDASTTKLMTVLGTDSSVTSSSVTVKLNGVDNQITFDPTQDTMSSLAKKISSGTGATAAFDSASGKLFIKSKETGANQEIEVSGDLFDHGVVDSANYQGKDAEYIINEKWGGTVKTSASNILSYDGLQITMKAQGEATIQTQTDTDKVLNTIKSFISDYNTLVSSLNSKLGEERYRTFLPLTDDQKKEMKEDEITSWQAKAKSGMLKNDDITSGLVSSMRTAVTGYVATGSGSININSIGIATGKWNEGGKLVIEDEAKLKQAIEQDPDRVLALFTASGTAPDNSDQGIFTRVSNIISKGLDDLAKKAGTSRVSSELTSSLLPGSQMGEEARTLDIRISDMKRKLTTLENNYFKQFTAMETAVNKYNAQSGSLSSFLN
ncbi:flagellar hook-associated protein 2 [Paenibacillus forsythiae]|uniref:Flagellar hook-associated protein 2 n=1 Tax=Paenibacillus forsythiae TaxID=365616 RepID=A0ABU3HB01_9BACL|nr:flagellar filament capping protein FliD [Paenibacillus forsythiae]MDT3428007.1 flagellar hook-associated protein 2 [Paenibacillus forsythiae]